MEKQTTGAVISRLGVLTVLANNAIKENHVNAVTRARYRREIKAIRDGRRGPSARKVIARSAQRCVVGGGLLAGVVELVDQEGDVLGLAQIGFWGAN